jgi:hypothetical protein
MFGWNCYRLLWCLVDLASGPCGVWLNLLKDPVIFEIDTGPCNVWLKLLQAPVMFGSYHSWPVSSSEYLFCRSENHNVCLSLMWTTWQIITEVWCHNCSVADLANSSCNYDRWNSPLKVSIAWDWQCMNELQSGCSNEKLRVSVIITKFNKCTFWNKLPSLTLTDWFHGAESFLSN